MSKYGELFSQAIARELRKQKQYLRKTNNEIADAAGTSPIIVLRYLKGQRVMPLDVFADICHVLEINPGEVLDMAADEARQYASTLTELQEQKAPNKKTNQPLQSTPVFSNPIGNAMQQLQAKAGWKLSYTKAAYHDPNKNHEDEQ